MIDNARSILWKPGFYEIQPEFEVEVIPGIFLAEGEPMRAQRFLKRLTISAISQIEREMLREKVSCREARPRSLDRDFPVFESELGLVVNLPREELDEILGVFHDPLVSFISAVPLEHQELGPMMRRVGFRPETGGKLEDLGESSCQKFLHREFGGGLEIGGGLFLGGVGLCPKRSNVSLHAGAWDQDGRARFDEAVLQKELSDSRLNLSPDLERVLSFWMLNVSAPGRHGVVR